MELMQYLLSIFLQAKRTFYLGLLVDGGGPPKAAETKDHSSHTAAENILS